MSDKSLEKKTSHGSTSKQPSSITTISSIDTQQSDREDDYATSVDLQNYGWKAVLLLQFQPQFEVILMFSIYLAYVCSLIDATFAYSTSDAAENIDYVYTATGISFIYSFDVIYMVDVLSMISYKNTEWDEVKHLYDKRHTLIILLDIISILPLDAIYYSLTDASLKVIYTIRLRYTLRIFRLMNRISQLKNTVGNNNLLIELLQFLISFSLLLITISCVQYLLRCRLRNCSYQDIPLFVESLFIIAAKMTSRGYTTPYVSDLLLFVLLTLTNFFSFLYVSGFTVGRWLTALRHIRKAQNMFANIKNVIVYHIYKSGCKDVLLYSTTKMYYALFWKNREGIVFDNFDQTIIPEIMAKEISLDNNWDSLKHSHLFRDKEVHFLRFIAPLMKEKFMIPGEVIYKRNRFKSCMVYIVSGVIQILSEQDGETPILSFSGGTCIGESTLLIDYPSTCTVICQSYCELIILHKKDFLKICKKYPKIYKSMLADINNRYKEVAQFQDILKYMLDVNTQKIKVLTLKWLKTTLQELMEKDKAASKDDKSLNLTDRNTKAEFKRLVFCTNYLDLLVITEQIELVTDTIFLKETCPCILQPDSFIVSLWNTIVASVVLLFVFIYPYHAAFQPNVSLWYLIYVYLMTGLFAFDIYIKLSTAIKTKEGIIAEIYEIALVKIQTYSFILDLVALIPIELFIVLLAKDISWQAFVLFQMPRLLKTYQIRILFNDRSTNFSSVKQVYLKFTIYIMILIYYIAAIFYLRLCYQFECETDSSILNFLKKIASNETHETILVFVYLSAQQVTNLGMKIPAEGDLSLLYGYILAVQLSVTLFYIYFLTNASSMVALHQYDKLKIHEYISDVFVALQYLHVNPILCKQVVLHIRGQMQYNKGSDMRYSMKVVAQYYHPLLFKEVCSAVYGRFIRTIPLFTNVSEEVLDQMTGIFHGRLFAPGEVITYAGEVCKEIHIILAGFCEMIEPSAENIATVIGPGHAISVIELCFGIPLISSTITLTHCRVLSTYYEQFMHQLHLFPGVYSEIKKTTTALSEKAHMEVFTMQEHIDTDLYTAKCDKDSSFKNFGYRLDMDTKEGVDYHTYFDKLGYIGFLRYIFMRHTITTYGSFLHYWEISRCIFAFATAILSPVALINNCNNCVGSYILLALDITAWIDIYVQHHICYFNEKGIEVTHPLKTAIYYWKHSLLVDLLGSLPFEHVLLPLFNLKDSNRAKVFFKTTRLLQVHRILGGIHYLENDLISPPKIWITIKFIPIILLTINTIGSMSINLQCEFGPTIKASKDFAEGVACYPGTWLSESSFEKPLSPIRTHLYGLYFATVVIAGPSLGGFNVQNMTEVIIITILSIFGFWFFIYISSKIIAANLFRNADLTLYQESMRSLVNFLSCRVIDLKLKDEVIRHFEYVWYKKKGKNIKQMIECFNYALQEDVLLDVYGKTMKESSIFAEANSSFFRSLLLNVKHEIVINRGIICRVNDIHNNIYFIFKGQVEVLGADYNRLLILPTGSLFGTLDNTALNRQTLTMVAKGHVELLCIQNSTFYKILSNYHKLKFHYRQLIAVNTDYLLGAPPPPVTKEESPTLEETTQVNKTSIRSIATIIINSFNSIKQSFGGMVWDLIILTFVCYIGSVLELYQITVRYHSSELVIFMYCLDALYILNIYLNFQTGYEDEFGIFITDKKKIALRYIKSRTGFGLDVASVLPVDLLAFFFTNDSTRWTVWSYCRCNRLIRIFFVNNYFEIKNQQLNINVNIMRTIALLVWVSLLLQMLTCLFIIASCVDPTFNVSPLMSCNWDNMTSHEKLHVYLPKFAVVLYVFTTSSMTDYCPNSIILILFTICLLIGGRFLTIKFVSEVSATLEIVLHNRVIYEEQLHMLRQHMTRQRTSPALLERVWLYVCLLWKHKRGLQFPNLLEEAPSYLQEGVLNSMFGYHLRQHAVLSLCHVDLIRQMATQLRPRTFFPGDYVAFINDIDECMYFIDEGTVDGLSEDEMNTERIEKTFQDYEMFGYEQGLYPDCGHELTYRVRTYSVILVLERKKWISLLRFFPASAKLIYSPKSD